MNVSWGARMPWAVELMCSMVQYHSSVCGPTWCWPFWRYKNNWRFFYVPNVPISTRIHGRSLCQKRCMGDQLLRYFLDELMSCRAGLKLFRTSLRSLLCHLGCRSMFTRHNTGSKSGQDSWHNSSLPWILTGSTICHAFVVQIEQCPFSGVVSIS